MRVVSQPIVALICFFSVNRLRYPAVSRRPARRICVAQPMAQHTVFDAARVIIDNIRLQVRFGLVSAHDSEAAAVRHHGRLHPA